MLDFLHKHAANAVFSQNGEEGIILECLSRIKQVNRVCVEIGANNGTWCSNTALLCKDGWQGKMVESVHSLWKECAENWKGQDNVKSINSHVDAYNINAFVDDKCDVLSIDTDGQDHKIFKALKAKAKIVIVEIDSSIAPSEDRFNHEGGAGYKPMVELGIEKGYFLLAHTGNLVFVANEFRKLFPEVTGDGLTNHQQYFKTDWLKVAV
jgi:hypothetical protein